MKRNSMVLYQSFYEAIKDLSPEDFKSAMIAIAEYGFNGDEYTETGIAKTVFTLVKPLIDKNNQRYKNGKQGGRPKNQTETKTKPKKNQTETNSEPNVYVNDNENVDGDVNVNANNNPPLSPLGGKHDYSKSTNVENVVYFLNNEEYKHKQYIRSHPALWSAIKEWMEYKQNANGKEKKHYQEKSIPKLLTEIVGKCEEIGEENAVKAIDLSIGRGYIGITWELANKNQSNVAKQTQSIGDAKELLRRWADEEGGDDKDT